MIRTPLAAAVAAALLAAPVAEAADILDACADDIATRCAEVEPGHGRLMACLYAYEDKVSDACDVAIGDAADLIDMMFERLRSLKQNCAEDIRSLCAGATFGQGEIFSCLAAQKDAVSEDCIAFVQDLRLPQD